MSGAGQAKGRALTELRTQVLGGVDHSLITKHKEVSREETESIRGGEVQNNSR